MPWKTLLHRVLLKASYPSCFLFGGAFQTTTGCKIVTLLPTGTAKLQPLPLELKLQRRYMKNQQPTK